MQSPWCFEAGRPQQVARTRWFTQRSVLKAAAHVCAYSDMFSHWFAKGAIPGSVTKGVIILLKKGGEYVWEGLDDYRPITLLNTELKIFARVLVNRLQLVSPEETYAVKGRSIQDNLHLIREVLEGIEDGTESALINLDQSKAFDRVDHRFLATVLPDSNRSSTDGLAWCTTTLRQWCRWTEDVRGRSRSSIRSGRAVPCLRFSMSSLWSPCSVGLGMRGKIRPCTVSLLLALLSQEFPRLPISQSLYPASWI